MRVVFSKREGNVGTREAAAREGVCGNQALVGSHMRPIKIGSYKVPSPPRIPTGRPEKGRGGSPRPHTGSPCLWLCAKAGQGRRRRGEKDGRELSGRPGSPAARTRLRPRREAPVMRVQAPGQAGFALTRKQPGKPQLDTASRLSTRGVCPL